MKLWIDLAMDALAFGVAGLPMRTAVSSTTPAIVAKSDVPRA